MTSTPIRITPARRLVLEYLSRQVEPVRINRRYRSTARALIEAGLVDESFRDMFLNDPAPLGFPMRESLWAITDAGRAILKDIQDGSFAREWIAENDECRQRFTPLREQARGSQIEEVGKQLRSMMPWLDPK